MHKLADLPPPSVGRTPRRCPRKGLGLHAGEGTTLRPKQFILFSFATIYTVAVHRERITEVGCSVAFRNFDRCPCGGLQPCQVWSATIKGRRRGLETPAAAPRRLTAWRSHSGGGGVRSVDSFPDLRDRRKQRASERRKSICSSLKERFCGGFLVLVLLLSRASHRRRHPHHRRRRGVPFRAFGAGEEDEPTATRALHPRLHHSLPPSLPHSEFCSAPKRNRSPSFLLLSEMQPRSSFFNYSGNRQPASGTDGPACRNRG